MNALVLELCDRELRLGNAAGTVASSSGFALWDGAALRFGEEAERAACLHPTQSYSRFWQDLSLDPAGNQPAIRHHADVAFAQLRHLTEAAGLAGAADPATPDILFAVPGHFSREQLAILLGIAKRVPLRPVALVNAAVAAVAGQPQPPESWGERIIHAELQLHQLTLSKLSCRGGQVSLATVLELPGLGAVQAVDLLMGLATAQFQQQCRFDPRHDAATEQQLRDQLAAALGKGAAGGANLSLELAAGAVRHTAKLADADIRAALAARFGTLHDRISAFAGNPSFQVIMPEALASLPGVMEQMTQGIIVQAPDAVRRLCLRQADSLTADPDALTTVTSLALGAGGERRAAAAAAGREPPTHLLVGNQAVALGRLSLLGGDRNGSGAVSLGGVAGRRLGMIDRDGDAFYVEGSAEYLLNDVTVSGRQAVGLGDRIDFGQGTAVARLIAVTGA